MKAEDLLNKNILEYMNSVINPLDISKEKLEEVVIKSMEEYTELTSVEFAMWLQSTCSSDPHPSRKGFYYYYKEEMWMKSSELYLIFKTISK